MFALWSLFAPHASAQSAAVLEGVMLHRPGTRQLAEEELEACRKIACPRAPHLAQLAGYLALSDGDPAGAAVHLSSKPPDGLETVHAYYLGQARFYLQDYAAAVSAFELALRGPPWLQARARARLGETFLALGDATQAVGLLEQAARESGDTEVYYQKALARAAVGDASGAKADLTYLALRHPAHPLGEAALARLQADHAPFRLTFEEHLRRARGFLDAGQPARSLEELATIERDGLDRGATAQARLALARMSALYALGRTSDAEALLARASRAQAAVAAEAAIVRARRALRGGDNARSRDLMAEIVRRWPREEPAAEAAFYVGWLELQELRFEEAVAALDAFEKRFRRSGRLDDAMWFKALALLKLRRYADARAQLLSLGQKFPRGPLVPQIRYWAARALQLAGGSTEEVAAELVTVRVLFAGTFYALLAGERLRELGQEVPPLFSSPSPGLGPALPRELALAQVLADAGLWRDAAEEVQERSRAARTAEDALRLGQGLKALKMYGAAHALASRVLWAQAYGQRDGAALTLFYPRAFSSAVEAEAAKQGVDPFFLWSLMRRESAFRPEVQSAADARGLMQLMPQTARAVADALQLPPPPPDELFSPALNIRLAAWYVAQLLRRFAHPVLAAASYNAGPEVTAKWALQKGASPLDLFVEELPYKETRGYVKQVVADYHIYHALYGQPGSLPRLALTVPAPQDGINY